jgi:N-formylglutamate deformylase
MKPELPILIIIPHGGREVPDEMSGYEAIDDFGIFIESDVYANELFDLKEVYGNIRTNISRLFIDIDRDPAIKYPQSSDGIIKNESLTGRKVFKENIFPDDIAAANIIRRYYMPFHNSINEAVASGEIKLILECHTMMPVGPRFAGDAGKPRPLINVENIINSGRSVHTCPMERAEYFLSCFNKYFSNEEFTVSRKFSLNRPKFSGYLMEKYGREKVHMLRFSISSSLFLNDKYFNYDYLTVDDQRIADLRGKISSGIEKYASKYL